MKLIMIVGQAGAGKTTAGKILQAQGYLYLEAGDIIRERFANEAATDQTILSFAEHLFESEGRNLHVRRVARTLYEHALAQPSVPGAVVVGFRTEEQVRELAELFGEVHVVAVFAAPATRFARVDQRRRSDDPHDYADFLREDYRELTWGLDRVLASTSLVVMNEGTLEDMKSSVLALPFVVHQKEGRCAF